MKERLLWLLLLLIIGVGSWELGNRHGSSTALEQRIDKPVYAENHKTGERIVTQDGGKSWESITTFKVGTDVYDVPAAKVQAFKKKYPNAIQLDDPLGIRGGKSISDSQLK